MTRPLVIYVDVDDTFVRSFGSKRIPMTSTLNRIKELHAEGAELYCWSSGGSVYARESAAEFGVEDCFTGFLPKPNILIDDVKLAAWHELDELHPNKAANVTRADLEKLLGREV